MSSSFTAPLQIEISGDSYVTTRDLVFWTGCQDDLDLPLEVRCTTCYTVPAGFSSDGASIPRLLWWLIGHPFESRFAAAAFLHDRLYGTHEVTRAEADRIFLEALRVLGAAEWRCRLMYAGVRVGGWGAYGGGA